MGNDRGIYRSLLPVAWLYGAGVCLRNFLFDKGVLLQQAFSVPVICIGNLTVGGTGKTPHTEYLIRLLRPEYQVAVLSRGYKRKSRGFVLGNPETPIEEIGDEPYQMLHKFPDVYVAVDADRCEGIRRLTDGHTAPGTRVILLDDAFQHRYVKPGISILLTDYNRLMTRDLLLPAGRLREPVEGKRRADMILVTKCPHSLSRTEREALRQEIAPMQNQSLFFTALAYGRLQSLFVSSPERRLESLEADEHVLLLTGIASPAPLIGKLSEYTSHVMSLTFPDHHAFDANDLQRVKAAFETLPEGKRMIITTEKDAARLIGHPEIDASLAPFIYVLPIEVSFLDEEERTMFNQNIIAYVRKNTRNSSLSEG